MSAAGALRADPLGAGVASKSAANARLDALYRVGSRCDFQRYSKRRAVAPAVHDRARRLQAAQNVVFGAASCGVVLCTRGGPPRPAGGPMDARVRGNIWAVPTARGSYYRVRLTLGGVVIASHRLQSRAAAAAALKRLRRCVASFAGTSRISVPSSALRGPSAGSWLHAVADVGSGGNGSEDLGLSFRVVLDARRWVGAKCPGARLVRTAGSACEALQLQQRLAEVFAKGPTSVYQEWCQWSREVHHKRGRPRAPLTDVQADVALWEAARCAPHMRGVQAERRACAEARRHRVVTRADRFEARVHRDLARREASCLRRLLRLAARAEAAMQREVVKRYPNA